MRWLALLILVLPAPARAQEGEAEKLYRVMEKKITSADSLALRFNSEFTVDKAGKLSIQVKGTIHVAAGNKTRLEFGMEGPGLAAC